MYADVEQMQASQVALNTCARYDTKQDVHYVF